MKNPDDYLYEYAVIRYMPRVERGEFINVGLIMMCKRQRWIHCELHLDPVKLKAINPKVNIERLRQQLNMFESDTVPFPGLPVEERYRWLTAAKSAIIQTSPSHPGIVYPKEQTENADKLAPLHDVFLKLKQELLL
ncbi:MAG: DUF3037 domain-containing protein [Muribaculaceae bacterium]|nr:DUF3037 domain-containing protein [Muribaculaceae bacterium]